MRIIDSEAIERHGAERFRSEYHYAQFEYWRSAKLLRYLANAGITRLGRVLDDGCGGGGMSVSFAEEAEAVVAIDLADRFRDAGTRLAAEQGGPQPRFSRADGTQLPFRDASFDLVVSHAVIEHVKNPGAYLREARRVLRPGGRLFLETAPYLSPSGVHLPRLRFPIPTHLLLGRRLAFRLIWWLVRHAPGTFRAPVDGSSFLAKASRGEAKIDDLYRGELAGLQPGPRSPRRCDGVGVLGSDRCLDGQPERPAGWAAALHRGNGVRPCSRVTF